MMVFERQNYQKGNILQRVFGIKLKDNVKVELNNLFVEREVRTVKIEEVHHIADMYKANLKKDYQCYLCEIYEKYLLYCLSDKQLSDYEVKALNHLKAILRLTPSEVEKIHNQAAGKIYKTELDKALVDCKLSDEEIAFLKTIQSDLKLSDEFVKDIYKESAKSRIEKFLTGITSNERISPEEEKELEAICQNLKVNVDLCDKTRSMLEKYKLFWQIENGELPEIDVRIKLQKQEKCHFHTRCGWMETRKVARRFNYSGPTLRFKIVKGVYWRAGSLKAQVVSDDVWSEIDKGDVYLTNKRIIFCGSKGNKVLNLNRILDFTAFSNGIDIQKDAGKSPFLSFSNNNELFALVLGRVIGEE